MKIKIFFFILIITFSCHPQSEFVSVKGKDFITPDGQSIHLRGINLGNWLVPEGYMFKFKHSTSPRLIYKLFNEMLGPNEAQKFWTKFRDNYITKDDIKYLKSTGLNSVRVPFNFRLFVEDENSSNYITTGFEMLDRVIKWCTEEQLYIILDMHCAPGGQTGDNIDDSWGYPYLFESKENQQLTIDIWKRIAEKYKDERYVIGYDLLNEPIAHYFDKDILNPLLEPFYKNLTAAIRTVDKNHILFYGGAQWDSNFKIFGEPFDSKAVYTFHKYWTDTTPSVIQEYLDFRDQYNVPIWMGESGENTFQWINSFRTLLDNNEISWCFWPYKKLDAESCIASVYKPELFDSIITFANSPRISYEELRKITPAKEVIQKALNDYLENIKFENCRINKEYLKALNLNTN
ncbi:MAG TPA: cellulase family glycosylhydrolase [Ignavibacteriaceae bacterium]|nr:cellulase family glycosylhydrolase [Ignavibacteriaceae bacterium]